MKVLIFTVNLLLISSCFCFSQCENLLTNGNFKDGTLSWNVEQAGGNGYLVQAVGLDSIIKTSFGYTIMSQTIDLEAAGYTRAELDAEPIIFASQRILGSGPNYGDRFQLIIELIDTGDSVMTTFNTGFIYATNTWEEKAFSIADYGPGLKSIYYKWRGRDTEFWSGYYGLRVDDARLLVGCCDVKQNMAANTNAEYGLIDWAFVDGGSGWAIAETNLGYSFQTSYNTCTKSQLIDLTEMGYSLSDLEANPVIRVKESFKGYDGGSSINDEYFLFVELRDTAGLPLAVFHSGTLTANANWQEVNKEFSDYSGTLQYVYIESGGRGVDLLPGNFGVLIDGAGIEVIPTSSINSTDCESFSINGITYDSSGTYVQDLVSSTGCDSALVVNFVAINAGVHQISLMGCNEVFMNGVLYNSTGVFNQTLIANNGCDSILEIDVTLLASPPTIIVDSICSGDSYTFPDGSAETNIVTDFTQTSTFTNVNGCDSAVLTSLYLRNTSHQDCISTGLTTVSSGNIDIFTQRKILTVKQAGNQAKSRSQIFLHDLVGRQVFESSLSQSGLYQFDLKYLLSGYYIVSIVNQDQSTAQKILLTE